MATITSQDEQQFVESHVFYPEYPRPDAWLGGYQDTNDPNYSEPDGGWKWVTGEEWDYTNWRPGEPNNAPHTGGSEYYLEMWNWDAPYYNYWNDQGPIQRTYYIVEFSTSTPSPVPEPATMFLLGSGLVGLAGFRRKFKKA